LHEGGNVKRVDCWGALYCKHSLIGPRRGRLSRK